MYWEPGSRDSRDGDAICANGHDECKEFATRVGYEQENKRNNRWSWIAKVEEYVKGTSSMLE